MTFEEKVRAAKAKFEEAANDLLELVSSNPASAGDILQIAHPESARASGFELQRIVETTITTPDGVSSRERFEVPYLFLERDLYSTRHETDPVEVVIPQGQVYVMVGITPENENRTVLLRELAKRQVSSEEYFRRIEEISASEGLYELINDLDSLED